MDLLNFNKQQVILKLVRFIKHEVEKAGFKKVIIGLSGGLDSSISLALAVKALGRNSVLAAILSYGKQNAQDVKDGFFMIDFLKIPSSNIFQTDIKPVVDSLLPVKKDISQIRKGNIIARVRMILLYDLAKKHKALVCGTENKSEHVLGYYTRFGDEASDLEPLRRLYKTQVRKLAKHLKIPEKIVNKPPSAGLWLGQTDEKELGFSYEEADSILHFYFDKKYSWEKIAQAGFNPKIIKKVRIWVKKNEFKSRVPLLPKI